MSAREVHVIAVLRSVDWIIAIITIAFCASSFGNGANDVANSFATSIASRTLTVPQAGIIAACTEFIGAVALGSRVTGTIKNGIIDINRYRNYPAVLVLAMGCAEFGSAFWLILATRLGFPVSTTQTVVGALIGVGIASQAQVSWAWKNGSVSQIAASWAIAPLLAGAFSAMLFGTIKFAILERKNSFEKAMRAIPWYFAFTGGCLALFMVVEAPGADSLEDLGAGTAVGIVLGTFFGVLAYSYIFVVPYLHRRLVVGDNRLRARHIPFGPLLYRENPPIYWPEKGDDTGLDYYNTTSDSASDQITDESSREIKSPSAKEDVEAARPRQQHARVPEPEERFLAPVSHLPWYSPKKLLAYTKYFLLQGVTRDCVTHDSDALADIHAAAKRYDGRAEHLFTYAQVASAMLMSIAHGSNDVANAVGLWVAAYETWQTGEVTSRVNTPIWILIAAGILLGAGFWFFGWRVVRSLGNKLTQCTPSRGFSMELGAAITVLLASRLGLPVSTTQCLTGAVIGVALMNLDAKAVNWKQLVWIFAGWVMTLPSAGLISGLLMSMSLNTPHLWSV